MLSTHFSRSTFLRSSFICRLAVLVQKLMNLRTRHYSHYSEMSPEAIKVIDVIIEEMKRRTLNRVGLIRESSVPEEERTLRCSFIGSLFEEVRIYRDAIRMSGLANLLGFTEMIPILTEVCEQEDRINSVSELMPIYSEELGIVDAEGEQLIVLTSGVYESKFDCKRWKLRFRTL